jgi:ABC-type transport system substrate-binding protein
MNTRATTAAVILALLGAVAGCSHSPSASPSAHGSSDPSPAAAAPSPMLTPTAPADTPLGAGQRVWAAFSERGLSYDAWWAQLEPLLSDSARAVYVYDDPRNLPAMKLTDKLRLAAKAPAQARYTAEVVVPTDKGDFALDLERHTLGSTWLLYAIKFPPSVQ